MKLRNTIAALTLLICLTLLWSGASAEAIFCAIPLASQSAQELDSYAAQIVDEVNLERARAGLSPVHVDAELTAAARIRAYEIVESFSHTRPDGSSWSTVSDAAYGENIAKGHNSVDRVMAAWMSSDGHRKNILRSGFGSIGVCALRVNGILYWVQLFGK